MRCSCIIWISLRNAGARCVTASTRAGVVLTLTSTWNVLLTTASCGQHRPLRGPTSRIMPRRFYVCSTLAIVRDTPVATGASTNAVLIPVSLLVLESMAGREYPVLFPLVLASQASTLVHRPLVLLPQLHLLLLTSPCSRMFRFSLPDLHGLIRYPVLIFPRLTPPSLPRVSSAFARDAWLFISMITLNLPL